MNLVTVNAIVLPLFMTFFLPVAIRNPASGKFLGFKSKNAALPLVALIAIEIYINIQVHGENMYTVFQVIVNVAIGMIGSLTFVKYTQKKLFGNEIKFTRWW